MHTNDGVIYTLSNYQLSEGEAKFRLNDDWAINWGNFYFPNGYGFQDGPNIPVPAGNYNVTFNRLTGYYYFEVICPDPVLQCPADIVLNAYRDTCGASVVFNMPSPADNCGNPYVYQYAGLPSGSIFPVGTTTNAFILFNAAFHTAYCSFNITVNDVTPPVITDVSASPASLWPPNHKMKDVIVNYNTSDICGSVTSSLAVSSNSPYSGDQN